MMRDQNPPADLLIVNCFSREFYYIPLGTFEIESYLDAHGFRTAIVNLSSYPPAEGPDVLRAALASTQPRMVGLVLHWKELLRNFIQVGDLIRREFPQLPIVAGGLTATAFAETLLKRFSFLDAVVRGDAEVPLEQLLTLDPQAIRRSAAELADVANIACRSIDGSVSACPISYVGDDEILAHVSAARLEALLDYPRYIENVNTRLGLPVSFGRGCAYNCPACGGSRRAFRLNCGRPRPVRRPTEQVVDDIETLHTHYGVDNILLSHTRDALIDVLRVLAARDNLRGRISINLECWELPDETVFTAYATAARVSAYGEAGFLFSPESSIESNRPLVKDRRLASSDEELARVVWSARRHLPGARVSVFFGYPYAVHDSRAALEQESNGVHHLREKFASAGPLVNFHLMTLSSDPGSTLARSSRRVSSELSLEKMLDAILFDRNLARNLRLHRPKTLGSDDIQDFERVEYLAESLLLECPDAYWVLSADLGLPALRELLASAAQFETTEHFGKAVPVAPLAVTRLLTTLKVLLSDREDGRRPFREEFLAFLVAREIARRLARDRIEWTLNGDLPEHIALNLDRVHLSSFDFEPLLERINDGSVVDAALIDEVVARSEPTMYVFLERRTLALPQDEYGLLGLFDGIRATSEIVAILAARKGWPPAAVRDRVTELRRAEVLI